MLYVESTLRQNQKREEWALALSQPLARLVVDRNAIYRSEGYDSATRIQALHSHCHASRVEAIKVQRGNIVDGQYSCTCYGVVRISKGACPTVCRRAAGKRGPWRATGRAEPLMLQS